MAQVKYCGHFSPLNGFCGVKHCLPVSKRWSRRCPHRCMEQSSAEKRGIPASRSPSPSVHGSWRSTRWKPRAPKRIFPETCHRSSKLPLQSFPTWRRSTFRPKFSRLNIPKSLSLTTELLTKFNHIYLSEKRHPFRHLDHLFITSCRHLSKCTVPYKYVSRRFSYFVLGEGINATIN